MSFVSLGELVSVQTGKLDANASSPDGAYPFFTCAREPLRIADWKYDLDAILVAGNGDLNVKHYKGKFDAYQRTYILSSKDQNRVNTRYLYHFMDTYLETLRAQSIGGIIKYIKLGMLTDAPIPLPPLDKQKRIAVILDQADGLRRKRQRAIDRLNQLGQAIFYEMFGDPVAPDANNAERLADMAELINGDRSSNYPSGDDIKDSGVLFLNTTNIKNGELDLAKSQFIAEKKFASLSRGKLARHDLVITLRGTLGQCALFDCEFETGFINAQMMIIRCNETIMPRYLKEYISFPSVQKKLNSANTGSAVPQLTGTQMKEMQIIVPSLSEQKKFVAAVDAARTVLGASCSHCAGLDNLFASLQHRAFQGEL
jgi:type I restriction enzyme S subunit